MMSKAVSRTRGDALRRIFGHRDKVLIGVVHLLPLPGAPDYAAGGGVAAIYARALADARAYAAAGFDGEHGIWLIRQGNVRSAIGDG